jgi:hypothetical protein
MRRRCNCERMKWSMKDEDGNSVRMKWSMKCEDGNSEGVKWSMKCGDDNHERVKLSMQIIQLRDYEINHEMGRKFEADDMERNTTVRIFINEHFMYYAGWPRTTTNNVKEPLIVKEMFPKLKPVITKLPPPLPPPHKHLLFSCSGLLEV